MTGRVCEEEELPCIPIIRIQFFANSAISKSVSPRDKKIEQVNRAEAAGQKSSRAHLQLRILVHRMTDFRPESYPSLKLSGERSDS